MFELAYEKPPYTPERHKQAKATEVDSKNRRH